jgi:hypothetical protein
LSAEISNLIGSLNSIQDRFSRRFEVFHDLAKKSVTILGTVITFNTYMLKPSPIIPSGFKHQILDHFLKLKSPEEENIHEVLKGLHPVVGKNLGSSVLKLTKGRGRKASRRENTKTNFCLSELAKKEVRFIGDVL